MFILIIFLSFLGSCSSKSVLNPGARIRHLKVKSDDEGLKLIQDKKNFYSLLIAQKTEGQMSPSFAEAECSRANRVGEIEEVRGGKLLSLRMILKNGAGFCHFDPGTAAYMVFYSHCRGQKYVTEFICPENECLSVKGKEFCL